MRCLIVDDNDSFLEVSRGLLEGEGVDVVGVASTLGEGVARARELEPDVILVDVDLGSESGLDLAHRMTGEQAIVGTHLILMSARREDEMDDLIEGSAAVGFLAKSALSRRAIETILAERRPAS